MRWERGRTSILVDKRAVNNYNSRISFRKALAIILKRPMSCQAIILRISLFTMNKFIRHSSLLPPNS